MVDVLLLLKRYGLHFAPENGQIRCIAHVVNLVVQKILHSLLEADDPALNDYYESHKHEPFHYDPDEDSDLKSMEAEGALDQDDEDGSDLNFGAAGPDADVELEDDLGDVGQSTWAGQSAIKKVRVVPDRSRKSPLMVMILASTYLHKDCIITTATVSISQNSKKSL